MAGLERGGGGSLEFVPGGVDDPGGPGDGDGGLMSLEGVGAWSLCQSWMEDPLGPGVGAGGGGSLEFVPGGRRTLEVLGQYWLLFYLFCTVNCLYRL